MRIGGLVALGFVASLASGSSLGFVATFANGAPTLPPTPPPPTLPPPPSPIRKVVIMLEDMRAQVAKEGDEDQEAYDTYKCWCETNEKEKTKAIEDGKQKIEELSSFLEEAAAKEGELKQDIETLAEEIAADKDALETATALRAKENAEFKAAEAEMKETMDGIVEAVKVLSKVQLLRRAKSQ